MKEVVVVGSGFSGAVIAEEIAKKTDSHVTVVEKRPHVGGNMYDETDEHGIRIHKYGPHVIVTNKWSVIRYLSQFSKMYKHVVKELSLIDGKYVRLPFNFESIQQLIGEADAEILIAKLRNKFNGRDRVPVLELANDADKDISSFGTLLFEKSYRTYCAKQWDVPVESLDTSIMNRVPMAMSYDERYMNKDFQFLPENGYAELFQNMLSHKNIDVKLNQDALLHLELDDKTKSVKYDGKIIDALVFTGAIDELFGLKYGELPYRSLDIRYEWHDVDYVFPEEIISCPQAKGYTRKTEYKYMMNDKTGCKGTTIATEYPVAYQKGQSLSPFYPVITQETKRIHEKYMAEAAQYKNIFLSGRLAEFRYYNMDDCILNALDVSAKIVEFLK